MGGYILLGGFVIGMMFGRYAIPMFDTMLDSLHNEQSLSSTLQQQELEQIQNDMAVSNAKVKNELIELEYKAQEIHDKQRIEGNVVGFQHYGREEYCEDNELDYKKK